VLRKRRVLEIYLNIAEWGPKGQFGAEAGSRYAFNKSVRSLTPREAALLAAVLPNPRRRSAKQPGPAVRRLALVYEARGAAQAALAACARFKVLASSPLEMEFSLLKRALKERLGTGSHQRPLAWGRKKGKGRRTSAPLCLWPSSSSASGNHRLSSMPAKILPPRRNKSTSVVFTT